MIRIIAFKGPTAYEAQIGRVWLRIPYLCFLRVGCLPKVGIEGRE